MCIYKFVRVYSWNTERSNPTDPTVTVTVVIYIYNTSKVFKQRKQLIWNLKLHADTAAIFSQMNKTLNLQYYGIFCIIWRHIKVFAKCFYLELVSPVIWWATRSGNQPDFWKQEFCVKRFVETFRENSALVFAIIRYQCVLVFVSAFI